MRALVVKLFSLLPAASVSFRPVHKACHCSIVFLRRTLDVFRFLKAFIVQTLPTRETKTGIAPPFSFSY